MQSDTCIQSIPDRPVHNSLGIRCYV